MILYCYVLQVDDNERVVVSTPSYFRNFTTILATEPRRNVANYMLWRAARASIGFLNKVRSNDNIFSILNSVQFHYYTYCMHFINLGCERYNWGVFKKCDWKKGDNAKVEVLCGFGKWKFFCSCWENVCSEAF